MSVWQEAFDEKTRLVTEHPLFPRLVKASTAADQARPFWIRWYQEQSPTQGFWIYRDSDGMGNGLSQRTLVTQRAMRLAKVIAADLECFEGWPAGEANGFTFGVARRHVQQRLSGIAA